jgi:hypothetical protein
MNVRPAPRARLLLLVTVGVVLALSPAAAYAIATVYEAPTSTELVESPAEYDGDIITFTGEAIGEVMVRGDMAWLHLNDDAYRDRNVEEGAPLGGYNSGMAVWIASDQTTAITHFGDHAHEGDVVRVTGTFNAACPEHGGDMDIHATSLEVITPGHKVEDPVDPGKLVWAVLLSVLAVAAFLVDRSRTRAEDTGCL